MSILKDLKVVEGSTFIFSLFTILLFISPGIAGIILYLPEVFVKLDVLKLILMAVAITSPVVILNTLVIDSALGNQKTPLSGIFAFSTMITGLEIYVITLLGYFGHIPLNKLYIAFGIVEVTILLLAWREYYKQKPPRVTSIPKESTD